MAQTYAYILTPDALGDFIDGIPTRGVPRKLTTAYLPTVGFKSTNHRQILAVLRFIGFIDATGVPTDPYRRFRNKAQSGAVMAHALREAYGDLYKTYPDAHQKDDEALRNFFAAETGLGERAVSAVVATFKALAAKADFKAKPLPAPSQLPATPSALTVEERKAPPGAVQPALAINIQLHIPATSDPAIYEDLFKALRKYVLDVSSGA